MTDTPDNPPAFPQLVVESCQRDGHGDPIEPFTSSEGGMTLRDYFAAASLPVLASGHCDPNAAVVWVRPEFFDGLAVDCYKMADAMLTERTRRKP